MTRQAALDAELSDTDDEDPFVTASGRLGSGGRTVGRLAPVSSGGGARVSGHQCATAARNIPLTHPGSRGTVTAAPVVKSLASVDKMKAAWDAL